MLAAQRPTPDAASMQSHISCNADEAGLLPAASCHSLSRLGMPVLPAAGHRHARAQPACATEAWCRHLVLVQLTAAPEGKGKDRLDIASISTL